MFLFVFCSLPGFFPFRRLIPIRYNLWLWHNLVGRAAVWNMAFDDNMDRIWTETHSIFRCSYSCFFFFSKNALFHFSFFIMCVILPLRAGSAATTTAAIQATVFKPTCGAWQCATCRARGAGPTLWRPHRPSHARTSRSGLPSTRLSQNW